jgi:circadian clock protein KaiC
MAAQVLKCIEVRLFGGRDVMCSIERIPTGVSGLDSMLGGGLPVPSLILVAGDIGAGKVTFCTQFLCKGAELGERGICFLIFGGPPDWERKFASTYDFVKEEYFNEYIKYVDLRSCIDGSMSSEDILEIVELEITKFRPKRIVIDKPSVLEDVLGDDYKKFLLRLAATVKGQDAITLMTGEADPGSSYPVSLAHVADGVILVHNSEINMVRRRSLEILKMRGTAHPSGKHALDISGKGLIVYPGL